MKWKEIKAIIDGLSEEELNLPCELQGGGEVEVFRLSEDWYQDDESPFPENAIEAEDLAEQIEMGVTRKIWSKGDIFLQFTY